MAPQKYAEVTGPMGHTLRLESIKTYKSIRRHLGKLVLRMKRCGLEEEALDLLPCMFQLLNAFTALSERHSRADRQANAVYYNLIGQFNDEVARRERKLGLSGVPVEGEDSPDIIGDLEPRLAFAKADYHNKYRDIDIRRFFDYMANLKGICDECMRDRIDSLAARLNELGLSDWTEARIGPVMNLVNQISLRFNFRAIPEVLRHMVEWRAKIVEAENYAVKAQKEKENPK